MNEITKQKMFSINEFCKNDKFIDNVKIALGENKLEIFKSNFISLLNSNVELLQCNPNDLLKIAIKGASSGLNALFGEYNIILRNDSRTRQKLPSYQITKKGIYKIAVASGNIKNIMSLEIKDDFNVDLFDFENSFNSLKLRMEIANCKGKTIGFYSFYKTHDNRFCDLYMSLEQMQEHAHKYSDQIKYCNSYDEAVKIKPNAMWVKNFTQMAEKTVIKLLLEKNPINEAINKAIRDDMTDSDNKYYDNQLDNAVIVEDEKEINNIIKTETTKEVETVEEFI